MKLFQQQKLEKTRERVVKYSVAIDRACLSALKQTASLTCLRAYSVREMVLYIRSENENIIVCN